MMEIGEAKGEFPNTPHRDELRQHTEPDTPEEAFEFAVKIVKTYFESMNDQEYDCKTIGIYWFRFYEGHCEEVGV